MILILQDLYIIIFPEKMLRIQRRISDVLMWFTEEENASCLPSLHLLQGE
jgi:hypothetical protein